MSGFVYESEWTASCIKCGVLGLYSIESAADTVAERHKCQEND